MKIWIPPEQTTLKEYVRYTTISSFVIAMLVLISFFVDEYNQAQNTRNEAFRMVIETIDEHNKKIENTKEIALSPPPLVASKKKGRSNSGDLPEKTAPIVLDDLPKMGTGKIEIDAGVIKMSMDDNASWNAIIKIMSAMLGTFFGVKLINHVFRRLEREPAPA